VWWPAGEDALRESAYRMGVFHASERKTPREDHLRFYQVFYGRIAMQVRYVAILGDRMPGTTGPAIVKSFFGRVPESMTFHPTISRYPVIALRLAHAFLTIPRALKVFGDDYTAWWHRSVREIPTLDHDAAVRLFRHALERFTEGDTVQILAVMSTVQPMFVFLEQLAESTGIGKARDLGGVSGNMEMEVVCDLWRVSRGQMRIEQVVETYGFHGPAEGELSSKVWREDDTPLRRMAAQYAKRDESQSPLAREATVQAERLVTEREVLAAVPWWKRLSTRLMLKLARRYLPLRGVAKCSFLQAFDVMRACARRIGEHLVAAGRIDQVEDVFYLTVDELTAEFPANAKQLVDLRRARRAAYMKLTIPGSWEGMPEVEVTKASDVDTAAVDTLHGVGVSRGVVEGRVRVVMNPDFADVEADEILVAPTTDPSWSSIMFISSAIIVDIGGALSHAAVVARELNIPCVVNTRTGTTSLRTGDLVRVDGTTGIVQVLERDAGGQAL
jgi:pyruvate,water dikinase